MRINIYTHLIIIEILDEIYARAQYWSTVEYSTKAPCKNNLHKKNANYEGA